MSRYDFAVVGGGLVGASVAEELAKAGATVQVLDAGERSGHATRQAAGVAVPSLRYLADPAFYDWLSAGRRRLDSDVARLEREHGVFSRKQPILRALRAADREALAEQLAVRDIGKWLDAEDLADVAPGFRIPTDRHLLLDDDGLMIDGAGYLRAVRRSVRALGVTWRQRAAVLSVVERPGLTELVTTAGLFHADRVVVAAGAWSGSDALGPGLPIGPQRGQLLTLTDTVDLPCIFSARHYLAPHPDGGVIVGATEEEAGFAERATVEGVSQLLRFALAVRSDLGRATVGEIRSGLRPVSGTGRPLVGRIPGRHRSYVVSGHAGHGLLSARLTAEGLAAGLLRDDWYALPEEFCPSTAAAVAQVAQGAGRAH